MFNKFFIALFIFINFSLVLLANEKELIISRLNSIDNITFNFEQITNKKKEVGTCILSFDNKLSCDYEDSVQKRIIINSKTLIIYQKRYGKIYFYPIANSPFVKIFNKKNLINLINKSDYKLNNYINLTIEEKNKEKIIIFFNKDNYDLVGWRVIDRLQNVINFFIEITNKNSEINPEVFKTPQLIKE